MLDGVDLAVPGPYQRPIMMFQSYALLPHGDGREHRFWSEVGQLPKAGDYQPRPMRYGSGAHAVGAYKRKPHQFRRSALGGVSARSPAKRPKLPCWMKPIRAG